MIQSVRAEPISGDVITELAIVSSLGKHVAGQYVLVRLEDDSGKIGLGEASVTSIWSGETQAGTIALITSELGPLLLGADPFDTEWICRRLDQAVFGNSFAKSSIEMALYDLQGKLLGLPVFKLLGGKNGSAGAIRLKFVVGAEEPRVAAERAVRMVQAGWGAIKVKVARHGDPRIDVERLRAVRDAIGPSTWLSVDANGGYTAKQAIWVAAEFEKLDVAVFEQPTPRGNHRAMAQVRAKTAIPVMADESVFTKEDALEIIRHEAADILSIYPAKHGGLRATQQIAKMAAAADLPCTIGSNLEREVATAAMAHVTVATANVDCERYPGDLIGPLYYRQHLTSRPLAYEADRLPVPDGPGLGVDVS
jgi:muconate cycloisomerase